MKARWYRSQRGRRASRKRWRLAPGSRGKLPTHSSLITWLRRKTSNSLWLPQRQLQTTSKVTLCHITLASKKRYLPRKKVKNKLIKPKQRWLKNNHRFWIHTRTRSPTIPLYLMRRGKAVLMIKYAQQNRKKSNNLQSLAIAQLMRSKLIMKS